MFAFAVLVMPGIKNLEDKEFIRAFQVIDQIIQNNQPIFILVWVGSVVILLASIIFGISELNGSDLLLLIFAALIYFLGVQLPTVIFNIPLNNKIQSLDVYVLSKTALKSNRDDFEGRWNRWNLIRTVLAGLVSVLLIILLISL